MKEVADLPQQERWVETRNRRSWHPKVKAGLYLVDAFAIAITLTLVHVISFGFANQQIDSEHNIPFGYTGLGLVLGLAWLLVLSLADTRNIRYLGLGSEEYRLVMKASTYFFATIIIISYLTKTDFGRMYVLLAYPIGIGMLLFGRWFSRRCLVNWRARGRALSRVMIIGDVESGNHLHRTLVESKNSGLSPVAAYLPRSEEGSRLADSSIPTLGYSPDAKEVLRVVRENNIHAVAVSTGHNLNPAELRRLGWALAAAHVALIMAPAMTDIAGPRIHTQPMNGMPLIHVHTPRLTGMQAFAKRSLDIVASGLGMILLAPLMLPIILLIKKDGGPAFFTHERIGYHGNPFQMYKLRSMVTNAEEIKEELIAQQGGKALLFKMEDDPRITTIGKFIRKYSIDELPQLWNVFIGDMSLVGPRPMVAAEVAEYEEDAYRRLLVKPGITGLWQVSGRSNLSWEESIRLDLYYVENWSFAGDLLILGRTVKAVFAQDGAY